MKAYAVLPILLLAAAPALADGRSVTFFSDGALVELETTAGKGSVQVHLPAGVAANSLRIVPLEGAAILQVDIQPAKSAGQDTRIEALLEQKERLEDRLRALSTREEVFKSAAKSQSGKAPRKTKSNPDPMQSIRQGTEFAIAQLEAVYTARRKAEQEVRRLNSRIAAARTASSAVESIVRVSVSPKNGRVKVSYLLADTGWTPTYDFRLTTTGTLKTTLFARLPGSFPGYRIKAAPGSVSQALLTAAVPASSGSLARLAEYALPISGEQVGSGLSTSFSCTLSNTGAVHLPAGEAALYRNGEYWGKMRFEGLSSGRSRRIALGE